MCFCAIVTEGELRGKKVAKKRRRITVQVIWQIISTLELTYVSCPVNQPHVSIICYKSSSYVSGTNCVCWFEHKVSHALPLPPIPLCLKSAVFRAGFGSFCLYRQTGQTSNIIYPSDTSCFAIWPVSNASTVLQHPTPPHHSLFTTAERKINGIPEETSQQKSMPGLHLCISHEAFNIFQDWVYMNYPSECVSCPGLGIRASWLQAFCFDTAVSKGSCRHQ